MSAKRTLNVFQITKTELEKIWELKLPTKYSETVYVRCNAKGVVDYETAPVFRAEELVERGNYKVHKS